MKNAFVTLILVLTFTLLGCEAVHKTTKAGGTYIGKGADAVGGITEGAAEGYVGETKPEDNPYNR